MLRCKFKLTELRKNGSDRILRFDASNQIEVDNRDWAKGVPTGSLQINVTNEAAFPMIDALNVGDHFYIEISPIEPIAKPLAEPHKAEPAKHEPDKAEPIIDSPLPQPEHHKRSSIHSKTKK